MSDAVSEGLSEGLNDQTMDGSSIDVLLNDRRHLSKLTYSIHSSSGHSAGYSPDRILVNDPEDQASRWSSPANDQHQYLMLELDHPAIVSTVTFGKFNKLHVCNLKEFQIFVGPSEECLVECLHTGLRNDTEPETFTVKTMHNQHFIPCKYVKIVPLASHGSNFNFSIWYVELKGLNGSDVLAQVATKWAQMMEREAWRVCLDFIRRNPLSASCFEQLSQISGVQVEDPRLAEIYKTIVDKGPLQAEPLIDALPSGLFNNHKQYSVEWTRIQSKPWPCKRGGHQMVYDPCSQLLWLFGGWDGQRELGDLWSFNPHTKKWKCVQEDARQYGGPSARSCHKLAVDPSLGLIYVMGRFVEPDQRAHQPLNSELFVYDTRQNKWTCLSEDTAQDGGPLLLYDHQMIVESNRLWVYGGKVVAANPSEPVYSGLWACDLATSGTGCKWTLIRPDDPSLLSEDLKMTPVMRSRIGHCMVYDHIYKQLHILHGQRMKDYLRYYYFVF